jgi:hypothetical protein
MELLHHSITRAKRPEQPARTMSQNKDAFRTVNQSRLWGDNLRVSLTSIFGSYHEEDGIAKSVVNFSQPGISVGIMAFGRESRSSKAGWPELGE